MPVDLRSKNARRVPVRPPPDPRARCLNYVRACLDAYIPQPYSISGPSSPQTHIRAYSRRREFHPLELTLAKAAPHHGDQPGHKVAR
jgi:hypothetical protein